MLPTKTFIQIITYFKKLLDSKPLPNQLNNNIFIFVYFGKRSMYDILYLSTLKQIWREDMNYFGREWIIQVWGSLDNVLSVMKNNLSAGAVKTYSNQTHMKHIFGLYMYREYLSPSYLINVSFLITYFSDQVIPKRYILVFFLNFFFWCLKIIVRYKNTLSLVHLWGKIK